MNGLQKSRLDGAPLQGATVLIDAGMVPLPGIYLDSPSQSPEMFAPLKIVQSHDGLVQTAHTLPQEAYRKYGFAGGSNPGYTSHLERVAGEIQKAFAAQSQILEVGCGDGTLLGILKGKGFQNLAGIDPSPQLKQAAIEGISLFHGFFPDGMPPESVVKKYDLIVFRHVLEHIESPNTFVAEIEKKLGDGGQIWIEVPDLKSTLQKKWWSNFYALHCNYFESATLDLLMAGHGFACIQSEVVPIFGGSLFRRYQRGTARVVPPTMFKSLQGGIADWTNNLLEAVAALPPKTWGWGAAERTAASFGFCPSLIEKIKGVVDGNPSLHGKFMAGSNIKIYPHSELLNHKPSAVVLFAISYTDDILDQLSTLVPKGTPVLIPFDPVRWVQL